MASFIKALALATMLTLCGQAFADPPARVGRIAHVEGEVTYQAAFGEAADPARLNWPITSQNIVSTGPHGHAEIRVGSTAVRVGPDTVLEVGQLDEDRFLLYLTDGSVHIRAGKEVRDDDFAVRTPEGRVRVPNAALFRVDVDRRTDTSIVAVHKGSVLLENADVSRKLPAGKQAILQEFDIHATAIRAADTDAFDRWSSERDRLFRSASATRYVSPEMTGYEELDRHGVWHQHASYGSVWYPTGVPGDWAPYRHGNWAWIDPWGWTWVDQAPWGYAPSHYGRWAHIDERWGWIPGAAAVHPVWAPALVGWIGGRNWNASFSFGNVPAVGWFPLGPNEQYVPGYRVSDRHLRRLNPHQTVTIPPSVTISPRSGRASLSTEHRNRFAPNAVSVLPQDRFHAGAGQRIVPAASALIGQPSQVRGASVTTIAPGLAFTTNAPPPALSSPQFTTGSARSSIGVGAPIPRTILPRSSSIRTAPSAGLSDIVPRPHVTRQPMVGSFPHPAPGFVNPAPQTMTGAPKSRIIGGHSGGSSLNSSQFRGNIGVQRGNVGAVPRAVSPLGAPRGLNHGR